MAEVNSEVQLAALPDDGTVEEITSIGLYEVISNPVAMIEKFHRALVFGGKATITCPYYSAAVAHTNPNAKRYLSEVSLNWANKAWRDANKISFSAVCDFDISIAVSHDPGLNLRAQDVQNHWRTHFTNVIQGIIFTLVKK